MFNQEFISFLIRAKQATYASGRAPDASSLPNSHDLHYIEGEYTYIDTYLGGFHFAGEEAVWLQAKPVWGMNYYGKMLVETIPDGFGEFLKEALLHVPADRPYRGPVDYTAGDFVYRCKVEGEMERFIGEEEILLNGKRVYWLAFHGGEIRD